jgi:hypothetical protein
MATKPFWGDGASLIAEVCNPCCLRISQDSLKLAQELSASSNKASITCPVMSSTAPIRQRLGSLLCCQSCGEPSTWSIISHRFDERRFDSSARDASVDESVQDLRGKTSAVAASVLEQTLCCVEPSTRLACARRETLGGCRVLNPDLLSPCELCQASTICEIAQKDH